MDTELNTPRPIGLHLEPNEEEFDVKHVVMKLRGIRNAWRSGQKRHLEPRAREFPSRTALSAIIDKLQSVLFPLRLGPAELHHENEDLYVAYILDTAVAELQTQALLELRLQAWKNEQEHDEQLAIDARQLSHRLALSLPELRLILDQDVLAAYQGDPAAFSVDEVLLCYPGVQALIKHRLAHRLHQLGLPLLARIVAEIAHSETGIDIHPGARIGPAFFIDHGTGVVIGATAIIGARVRIYQAVTLGARRFETDDQGLLVKGNARHPIVEDDVVIYAGATILGRIRLGKGSVIGGNVWLTQDVPPGASVFQPHPQIQISAPKSERQHA